MISAEVYFKQKYNVNKFLKKEIVSMNYLKLYIFKKSRNFKKNTTIFHKNIKFDSSAL